MDFQVEGYEWEDEGGTFHREEGQPEDLSDTYSVFVHVTDPDDPEAHRYFWAHTADGFDTWDEWFVYVVGMMEMYGLSYS